MPAPSSSPNFVPTSTLRVRSRCQKDFLCTKSIWAGPDGFGAQLHMGLDHVVTFTYALSLLIHFRTGFFDDSGVLVMSWKLSAISYIR
jgi:hypothetical protein